MKKDLSKTIGLLSRIAASLHHLRRHNISYYKSRIKEFNIMLSNHINKTRYMEGSEFHNLHKKVLLKTNELESSINSESNAAVEKKAKEVKESIEDYSKKLEQKE